MKIAEMHKWFRQYAQQMGMQNVRAILPEQIDMLINTSITDIVNQIIKENIGVTNDRVITDNSKIGQINALNTLYKVEEIPLYPYLTSGIKDEIIKDPNNALGTVKSNCYFDFYVKDRYKGKISNSESEKVDNLKRLPEALYIVDFSINYKKAQRGYPSTGNAASPEDIEKYSKDDIPRFPPGGFETNYFPVRLIDDSYLADTLNDFVLAPRLRSPIIVTYNSGTFDIYIEKFIRNSDDTYTLRNNLLPYTLRYSYIAAPAKVEFNEDTDGLNKDCDLPEYLHIDVLKHAVDLWRLAITGSLQGQQQQDQVNQQEAMRNNYRNEGNQRQS